MNESTYLWLEKLFVDEKGRLTVLELNLLIIALQIVISFAEHNWVGV